MNAWWWSSEIDRTELIIMAAAINQRSAAAFVLSTSNDIRAVDFSYWRHVGANQTATKTYDYTETFCFITTNCHAAISENQSIIMFLAFRYGREILTAAIGETTTYITLCSEKNTRSHFLSYLHELFVNLNKNCSEYIQGLVDSDSVKIRYSLRSMT